MLLRLAGLRGPVLRVHVRERVDVDDEQLELVVGVELAERGLDFAAPVTERVDPVGDLRLEVDGVLGVSRDRGHQHDADADGRGRTEPTCA